MSRLTPLCLLASLLALPACTGVADAVEGEAPVRGHARELAAFTQVAAHGSMDVEVSVGGERGVTVEAPDRVAERVRAEVEGGTLAIGIDDGPAWSGKVVVRVTTPELVGVRLSGSGDVRVDGVRGPEFAAAISGSGSIAAAGAAEAFSGEISGSGDLRAFGLQAARASLVTSGSGDAEVSVGEALDVTISGSGDVTYRGEPTISRTIAGSGSVRPAS